MQWRCHDCFGEPVFCTNCIQARHSCHPFHRISRWDGTCFIRSSLSKAGLTLNLGHNGDLCPRYILQVSRQGFKTPVTLRGPSGRQEATRNNPRLGRPHFTAQPTAPDPAGELSFSKAGNNDPGPADEIDIFFSSHTRARPSAGNELLEVEGSVTEEGAPVAPLLGNDPGSNRLPATLDTSSPAVNSASRPKPEVGVETPVVFGDIDITGDPFFANESEEEDDWKSVETGGVPLKPMRGDKKLDSLQCPMLTVVDIGGVHELRTRFCRCHDLKENPLHKQLLAMGLYPASTEKTRTVFTFRVLDHFDLSNLEGKIPSYKYYEILKRLTSNAFPDMVPDRYRELMRCLRQWRDLQARRRAGHPFESVSSLKPGSLALFCPACPQPGVNLPDDWKSDPQQ